jgi:hypothetical protein
MKFTGHTLTKADGRVFCTTCKQSWAGSPRTDCPGVPVVAYDHKGETLLTLHQLEKAHLHPADAEQPDAVYRTINQPYFRPLYDWTKAIPWTAEEIEAERQALDERERKRQENQYKYTCQICGEYKPYPSGAGMKNRVCSTCQRDIMEWNRQIERVQRIVRPETLLIDFVWNEDGWPFNVEVHGYMVLALESGELLCQTGSEITPEDQQYMLDLLERKKGKLIFLDYPMARLIEKAWKTFYIPNKRLHLRMHDLIKYYPLSDRRYGYLRDHDLTDLCSKFGVIVSEDANDAELLRTLLLHINQFDRTLLPEEVASDEKPSSSNGERD